jgi:putative Mn2+ efflux pump MntP
MILKIVAFVLPLGLDTLAISIALGLRGSTPWRPALTFAVFEGLMPILGIVLRGSSVCDLKLRQWCWAVLY